MKQKEISNFKVWIISVDIPVGRLKYRCQKHAPLMLGFNTKLLQQGGIYNE